MIHWKKTLLALASVYILGAAVGQSPAAAGDSWYNSKPAWAVYGLGTGALVGHLVTANHYERRDNRYYRDPYYREPRYGPYRPDYYQPSPASSYGDGYYHYEEKRVWPFYKRVEAEYIPALPAHPGGNAQAVSMAEYRALNPPQPVVINIYSSDENLRVEQGNQPGTPSAYRDETDNRRIVYRAVPRVAISNAAGSMFGIEPKAKPAQAPPETAKEASQAESTEAPPESIDSTESQNNPAAITSENRGEVGDEMESVRPGS